MKIEEALKKINGNTIWFRSYGFNIECVILADMEHGISVKPLDIEDCERQIGLKWPSWEPMIPFNDPRFCLMSLKSRYMTDNNVDYILENLDREDITREQIGNPVCGHAG